MLMGIANLNGDESLVGCQMARYWRTGSMGMADSGGMAFFNAHINFYSLLFRIISNKT
jgi:hypothetical protein